MSGRLFVLSAFPAMWVNENCSLMAAAGSVVVVFVLLVVIDSGRGLRTRLSTVIARFMFAVCMFVFVLFYLLGNQAAGRAYWTLADCLVVPFWVTAIITTLFWLFAWVGTLMVNRDPDYQKWVAAGGHYFWDLLPRLLNPDSDLVRNGGLVEPSYSGFVPPDHWQHQCPKCLSRVQHAVDVCWNCNYGADGDSTAYFDRHGR